MKILNKNGLIYILMAVFIAVGVLGFGCTLDSMNGNGSPAITKDELRQVSSILGESLSDDNSGVVLSIRDALSIASEQGITGIDSPSGTSGNTVQTDRSGRGVEQNYEYQYNSTTGQHIVSFERLVELSLFSKEVDDSLTYAYSTSDGSAIQYPASDPSKIYSIFYTGLRSGNIQEQQQSTHFTRKDTFAVRQLSGSSSVINLNGVHNEQGVISKTDQSGATVIQDYELEINFLNLEIPREALASSSLYRYLSGVLSWEMTFTEQINNSSDTKFMQGTIILNGDGTGQLRFQDKNERYNINLNNGEVNSEEKSFGGELQNIDIAERTLTLISGRSLYFTDSTEVKWDDNSSSLQDVKNELNSNVRVWAHGEGFIQNGRFIATKVEFEKHGKDEEQNSHIEFEDAVTAVDTVKNMFSVNDSLKVLINGKTEIDNEGDLLTLAEVKLALLAGDVVIADGEGIELAAGAVADIRALELQFKLEDSTGLDDGGDNGNNGNGEEGSTD